MKGLKIISKEFFSSLWIEISHTKARQEHHSHVIVARRLDKFLSSLPAPTLCDARRSHIPEEAVDVDVE